MELHIEGKFSAIWNKLREELDKINANQNVEVFLTVDNETAINSYALLPILNLIGNRQEINFNIAYKFILIKALSERWKKFAQNMYNNICHQLDAIREYLIYIKNISLNFKVEEVDYESLYILEEIKSLNTDKRFSAILFEIRKCLISNLEIDITENKREHWEKAWESYKNIKARVFLLNSKGEPDIVFSTIRFSVEINKNEDVTNLRYYLPLRQHLVEDKGITVYLNIYSFGGVADGTAIRIFQFFCFQTIDEITITRYGGETVALLDRISEIYKISFYKNRGLPFPHASNLLPMLRIESEEDQNEQFNKLINVYQGYLNSSDIIKGLNDYKLTKSNKDELKEKLNKQIFMLTGKASRLSRLIFLFIVRNLIENKAIFVFNGASSGQKATEVKINKELLLETWSNSKTYAECLAQIIENSQIHSIGKTAYFGMRVYNSNPNESMNQLVKQSKTREMLWHRYWRKGFTKRDSKVFEINTYNGDNIFNKKQSDNKEVMFTDFIEFYVLDSAVDKDDIAQGISDVIIKNKHIEKVNNLKSIGDIFRLEESDYKESEQLKYYTEHYGMRLLRNHVDHLNGLMEIYSPNADNDLYKSVYSNVFSEEAFEFTDIINLYFTEYSILIPLSYNAVSSTFKKDVVPNSLDIYDYSLESFKNGTDFSCYKILDLADILHKEDKQIRTKSEIVKLLYDRLIWNFADKYNSSLLNYEGLLYIVFKDFDNGEVEVFAKVLFTLLYNRYAENDKAQKSLNIAIDFGEEREAAREFIRIFSIFYIKQENKRDKDYKNIKKYMQDVQIAICSDHNYTWSKSNGKEVRGEKKEPLKEVNFILAGENLRSVYNVANNFVYYNADASIEFLPILDFLSTEYITNIENGNSKIENKNKTVLFPFDLFLVQETYRKSRLEQDKKENSEKRSWFSWQMLDRLETDLRSDECGCMVSNIRARLGSKIHLDRFYEAELLFHNAGAVKRFAYLIAQDIMRNKKRLKKDEKIFVLGYENYSAVLIQEVYKLLKEIYGNNPANIFWDIETHSDDFPTLSLNKFNDEEKYDIANSNIFCITIIPISAAMSTIYKLHASFEYGINKLRKKYCLETNSQNNINFNLNYCIVAIGNAFTDYKFEEDQKIIDKYLVKSTRDKYWEASYDWYVSELTVCNKEQEGIKVRFLLSAGSKWYEPDSFHASKNNEYALPLLQVDKTSTLLDTYFQIKLPDEIQKYYEDKDLDEQDKERK